MLTDEEIAHLKSQMTPAISTPHNVNLLSHLTRQEREYFALKSQTVVLYFGDEVAEIKKAEEEAALRAAPSGFGLERLQGLNIGCGDRTISPYLLPVDIMRSTNMGEKFGEHGKLTSSAFLALSDDLPFKPGTVDYIVALHMLEHVEDPVGTINHWLEVVKPGGGIGIIVPDWRYTWDSRNDRAPFSHKWNPTVTLAQRLFEEHWADRCDLEHLGTYDFKMSFDFVLRKHGEFVPFSPPDMNAIKSGFERNQLGVFLSD